MSRAELIYPCIEEIIDREGGFWIDPNAGATNMGITIDTLRRSREGKTITAKDVRNLDRPEARRIYKRMYLIGPGFNGIKDRWLRGQVVDAGVLHGSGTAKGWLQEAACVKVDYDIGPITLKAVNKPDDSHRRRINNEFMVKRNIYIGKITQDEPEKYLEFLEGWLIRAGAFVL